MDAFWIDCKLPGRLAIVPRPRGGDWLVDDLRALRRAGIDVVVSLLTAEETQELGLQEEAKCSPEADLSFISFPISDRSVPASRREVEELVEELKAHLAAGKAVGIHCRVCIGRSALIAACLLVEGGVAANHAFARISEARKCAVPDTQEQVKWVEAFAATAR